KQRQGDSAHLFLDAFRSTKVWILAIAFFGLQMGNYGLAFWLPQILKDTVTGDPLFIGLVSTIPWGLAAISMILWAHHSDRTGERRWHAATGIGVAGLTLAMGALGISGWLAFSVVTVTTVSLMCTQAVFWSLPTAVLSGAAAAAGIAWINSVGNLAGYVSPFLVGRIRDTTGSMALAYMMLGGSSLLCSVLLYWIARPKTPDPQILESRAAGARN